MSVTAASPGAPAEAAASSFLRRNRVPVLLGTGMLLLLLLITWVNRDQGGRGGALDPENPGASGSRAIAQVLADQGVEVDVVRGAAAFGDAVVDARTTVVVSNPDALGASTWDELDRRVSDADAVLVVVGLGPVVADGLRLGEDELDTTGPRESQDADCAPARPLLDGLRLASDADAVTVAGDGCFGDRSGRRLLIDRQEQRWVLTDPVPFTNDQVDRADNAAIALRLLGQRDRVVWYVADVADTAASDGVDLGRLLPDWLIPSLWLIGVATLTWLLVRGRRLGPLVVEPVPVTIKALESTTSLGRLYERARDRGHAAELLVAGSVRRLAPQLGLAAGADRRDVVTALAERTGRRTEELTALFPDSAATVVRTDADLVALAQNLHRLEEEVRNR